MANITKTISAHLLAAHNAVDRGDFEKARETLAVALAPEYLKKDDEDGSAISPIEGLRYVVADAVRDALLDDGGIEEIAAAVVDELLFHLSAADVEKAA